MLSGAVFNLEIMETLPLKRWKKAHFTDAVNLKHKKIIQQLKQLKKEKISVLPLELGVVFQS